MRRFGNPKVRASLFSLCKRAQLRHPSLSTAKPCNRLQ